MFWSLEVKILIIGLYFSEKSVEKVLELIKNRYPGWEKYPGISTIRVIVKKFNETGICTSGRTIESLKFFIVKRQFIS